MKQVVAAFIVRSEEILICQRAEDHPMPLKWEFPGGKIEPGERPEQALARELEEELGIIAVIGSKAAVVRHTYSGGQAVELQFYWVQEYLGEIQNRIFHDVRWVNRSQLADYDFLEADISVIRELVSGALNQPGAS